MKRFFAILAALSLTLTAAADEGMWLLPLLQKMNGKALHDAGCKLSMDDIYSINHSSLKDNIVHFGGGCTGEIISAEGLIVTNHHCGYSSIQALSTDEHNYLMDGYWAMTRDGELPAKGLSVTFLQSMTDVTEVLAKAEKKIAKKVSDPAQVDSLMQIERKALLDKALKGNKNCKAVFTTFYNDNYTYIIVTKTYTDIRFVGAPPASVGKFGGETDNWMWPRHTGDFSMFRVYAGKDNEPADYSPENRPYKAKNHLKISLDGLQEGDFAMIMGYPGRTQRFQTAAQLKQMIKGQRIAIDARTVRQDIMWEAMCADPSVQLKYANKYAGSANGWKKWQGEELAFENLDIIGRQEQKERDFMAWVNQKPERQKAYGDALQKIEDAVTASAEAENAVTLLSEAPYRIELVGLAGRLTQAVSRGGQDPKVLEQMQSAYRDYVVDLDRKEAVALLDFYRQRASEEDYPKGLGLDFEDFGTMDIPAYVNYLFDESAFTSYDKLSGLVEAGEWDKVWADPAYRLYTALITEIMERYPAMLAPSNAIDEGAKAFTAGLLEWEKGKPSYPDANSTMRLTYGHVLPYSPKDAVLYKHYSTVKGVLEKEDPTNPEFIVPERLKQLIEHHAFGRYADPSDGLVHTCFLTNNDITGGNSGSPVLNARGELIGLAFDGNWESMSSDVMFEPDLQRCICVDIRYVLFLTERLGGAHHIIRELDIVQR
ncbi:MAG: S46 family peptidase [Bacteroidales bacterium]|nr:S46 family peptidase [Bacteroidales bacterium]